MRNAERRRLSRTLSIGEATARGETRTPVPKVDGKLWRPDVVVERADEASGEVAPVVTTRPLPGARVAVECPCGDGMVLDGPAWVREENEAWMRRRHRECEAKEAKERR